MHHPKSASTIYRFRFAAFLLCTKYVVIVAALGVLVLALGANSHKLAVTGVGLLGLMLVIAILQWLFATRAGCPLCMTPVLARKYCVTHRHARTVLGSYRLRVALSILFKNTFLCPYCNEMTTMSPRTHARDV